MGFVRTILYCGWRCDEERTNKTMYIQVNTFALFAIRSKEMEWMHANHAQYKHRTHKILERGRTREAYSIYIYMYTRTHTRTVTGVH